MESAAHDQRAYQEDEDFNIKIISGAADCPDICTFYITDSNGRTIYNSLERLSDQVKASHLELAEDVQVEDGKVGKRPLNAAGDTAIAHGRRNR